jgi:hypothetical protein
MVTLAGLSAMTMPIYVKVIDNGHKEAFELSQWYIKFQKDWRWQEAITLMEYHSMASNMSNKGALDAKEAVDIGRMLQLSEQRRIRADEIVNELRTEFLSLDTALEKEDRSRITDMESIDFMKFETHLGARQKALKQNASSA